MDAFAEGQSLDLAGPQDSSAWGTSDANSLDLMAMALRHWLLLTICGTFALGLGVLWHLQQPREYVATVEIVIETKTAPVFTETASADQYWGRQTKVQTAISVIGSSMIMERAAEIGNIGELPSFQALMKENPEADLISLIKKSVEVNPIEEFSPILQIDARSSQEQDCVIVANTVAAAYEEYVKQMNHGSSQEINDLISEAKDELLDQLNELESDYAEFQQGAPLIWKNGTAVNIHHERQIDLEQKRKELKIEKSMLDAKVQNLSQSIALGGASREAVHFQALSEFNHNQLANNSNDRESETAAALSRGLAQEYLGLVIKEREMSQQYGQGHPELAALRTRIAGLRRQLKMTILSESSLTTQGTDILGSDLANVYVRVLRDRSNAIEDQLMKLDKAFEDEEVAAGKVQGSLQQEQSFQKEIDRTEKLFNAVVARLDEVSIVQDYEGDSIRIIESAKRGEDVSRSLASTGLMSLLGGLALGMGLAFLLEKSDGSFTSPAEIRNVMGAPILAQVPKFKEKTDQPPSGALAESLHTHYYPKSRAAEAFRGLRTTMYFNSVRKNLKVLQITSPMPGDGKSTLVANLAIAIANSGKSVVVVDADCRRPKVHKLFGLQQASGTVQVIRGECDLDEAIRTTEVENLFVVSSGDVPQNPSELLSSDGFDKMLGELRETFDFVLVDSPPILAVTDGSAVAAKVDGVVMVVRLSNRARNSAIRAKQALQSIDAELIGIVVNAVDANSKTGGYRGGYGYRQYGYGYGGYGKEIHEYYEEKDSSSGQLLTHATLNANGSENGNGSGNGATSVLEMDSPNIHF